MKSVWKVGAIVLLSGLVACGSDGAKNNEDSEKTESEVVDYKVRLNDYKAYVSDLEWGSPESSTLAIKEYRKQFAGAPVEVCDEAFVLFNDLYEEIEANLNKEILKDTAIQNAHCGMIDKGRDLPHDPPIEKLEKRIEKHGFKVECWEGMPSVGLDRKFIAAHFYTTVSPVMRKFLTQLEQNSQIPLAIDAGIVIKETEFVDRTVWWENFVSENPNFILIDRADALKKEYFTYLVTGMNNTAALSYSSGLKGKETVSDLNPYFVKAYTYLDQKYPASETNQLIKPYYKAAAARDFAKVKKLKEDYTKKGFMIDFEKDFESFI